MEAQHCKKGELMLVSRRNVYVHIFHETRENGLEKERI